MEQTSAGTTVDIALGFDRTYAPHGAATIRSVVRHSPGAGLRFIILHAGIDAETRARVEAVAPDAAFFWAETRLEDLPEFTSHLKYLNAATLLRLGLERLAPADCRRVVYLDSDTIVLDDVRELWNADLKGAPIGAVPDLYIDGKQFAETWSLPGADQAAYFNSGVLLIDLDRIRSEGLFEATAEFIARNGAKLPYGDQDALNAVFWRRWQPLDAAWNVQRPMTGPEMAAAGWGRAGPSIIHYITKDKPWTRNVWHHWAWLYWDNLRQTSFAREVSRTFGMDLLQLLRLRLRYLVKRPRPH
jgi:lipopolysaccharide biosynthesis glycosyltransferase